MVEYSIILTFVQVGPKDEHFVVLPGYCGQCTVDLVEIDGLPADKRERSRSVDCQVVELFREDIDFVGKELQKEPMVDVREVDDGGEVSKLSLPLKDVESTDRSLKFSYFGDWTGLHFAWSDGSWMVEKSEDGERRRGELTKDLIPVLGFDLDKSREYEEDEEEEGEGGTIRIREADDK